MEVSKSIRAYQAWPSKNRFCPGGRCMTGPWSDCGSNSCVWISIFVPVFLFYFFSGPATWKNAPALLFVVAAFFTWTVVALVLTGWRDPGIIPRQTREQAIAEAQAERDPSLDEFGMLTDPPGTLTRTVGEEDLIFRYCKTCHIYKPPRCSHCRDCDNCVKEYDHHCPFVGNCVGERNYGSFMAFLLSVVALSVSVLLSVVLSSQRLTGTVISIVLLAVVGVFSLVMCCVIGGFSAFHISLVLRGKTTKEYWKGAGSGGGGARTLCKHTASLLRPRAFITPEQAITDEGSDRLV